jgi:hypothetical protein
MVQTKRHGREEGSMEVMGRGTQAYQRPGTRLGIQNNRENRTEDSSGDKKVGEEREEHRGGEPEGPNLPAPRDSAEGEDPEGPEELSQTLMPPRGNLKVAYQNTEEEMRDVGQAVKKKMGHLRKNEVLRKVTRRPFPQVQTRGMYLTKKREGAWTLKEMGSTRVEGMGEGPALQAGNKISS